MNAGGPDYRIELPFWSMSHPEKARLQLRTMQWAQEHGLLRSKASRKKFQALGYGRVMSYLCPTVALQDLELITCWNICFFLFDDQQNSAMLAAQETDYDRLQAAVRRAASSHGTAPDGGHPLVAAVSELCRQSFPRMSSTWAARFEENLHRWLDGHSAENEFRALGTTPTVDEYGTCPVQEIA